MRDSDRNSRSEKRENKYGKAGCRLDGAITILTTISVMLILSLVLVSLESARQQGAVTMVRMNTQMAAESVLGEYYAPLFDEYGLYGLYGTDIEEELRSYLEASAKPSEASGKTSDYGYAYEIADVALARSVGLLYGGASICKNQMIEEGAVSGAQDLAEMLLRAVNLLKDSESVVDVLDRQQKVELQLSKYDEKMLELMKWIDGLETDKTGVVFQKDGTVKTHSQFVKRAVNGTVSAESVHMNNEAVFRQLESKYTNITAEANAVAKLLAAVTTADDDRWTLIQYRHAKLAVAVQAASIGAEKALPIIDELIELQDTMRPMVREYEKFLETMKSAVDEDLYESLESTLKTMKTYVGLTPDAKTYDFDGMKATLSNDYAILSEVRSMVTITPKLLTEWKTLYSVLPNKVTGYSLDHLEIDYSLLRKSSASETSFWAMVKSAVTSGIVGGVYSDDTELSKTSIWFQPNLPSTMSLGDLDSLYVFPELEEGGSVGVGLLKSLLQGNLLRNLMNRLADGIVEMSEKILLIAYMADHMSCFADSSFSGVMHYEQEYLLYGSRSDSANQKSATKSILGIRVLMNILHVFTDTAKKAEALAVATELLSVIPLPILIKLTEYVILVIWAVQNAYLETAELIAGKSVPLAVTSESFQLSLTEAVSMTKAKRLERAEQYVAEKGFRIGYRQYLLLLMMFRSSDTLTVRALDLIQLNIRAKYEPKFLIRDCVYGFEATVTADIPALYTGVAFGDDQGADITEYSIQEKCAVSY